jgi:hypothetical protein
MSIDPQNPPMNQLKKLNWERGSIPPREPIEISLIPASERPFEDASLLFEDTLEGEVIVWDGPVENLEEQR